MNIATMVRGYITAPHPKDIIYAPIDIAITLSEQLTKRGHHVTYFGPTGTNMEAAIETHNLPPLVRDQQSFQELLHNVDLMVHGMPASREHFYALDMFKRARAGEFDLLHFHHPEVALPYAKLFPDVPVVFTLHDPVSEWYKDMFELHTSPNQHFISISNNQRRTAPDLPYAATIYNGTNTELFTYEEDRDGFLLFAGRLVAEKGIKEAVEVAQMTNHRLLIIGPTYNDNRSAFDRFVKPHLNEKILYLGFLEQSQVVPYYQKAKALLIPIQWEEPFGLTMIEAMSCGTPVLAMNRGSVPEIIADSKTGFIVNSVAEMAEAVGKVDQIQAQDCREYVQERFSNERMVDDYEKAFVEILASKKMSAKSQLRKVIKRVKKSTLLSR